MKFPSPPQIILSEDFYKKYPTSKFFENIKTANKTLNDMSSGKEGGEGYQLIKQALIAFANGRAEFPQIEGIRDIQRIIAVLNQEKNSANNENNDIFQQLIDNNKALYTVQIIGHYLTDNNNLIGQKLLELYYNRYFLFENNAKAKFATLLKSLLKRAVNNYDGKNHRVKKAQETPSIIENNLKKLLEKYSFNSNQLEDLRQELCLQEGYEIWQKILILQIIDTVNQWQANENNDDVRKTWREIEKYKNTNVDNERTLLEEVVRIMVSKCKKVNKIDDTWLNRILHHVGDPRASRNEKKWLRIGSELYQWLRAKLSQGDVREFLENMTDGHGDKIYQYRRQFWLAYVEYVQYAKVMLNQKAIDRLQSKNKKLWKRFKTSPETYSLLTGSDKSCIYIDFGDFKVIEGTHSAKVRFYNDVPINLADKYYSYDEFYGYSVDEFIIAEFIHTSSESYSWQGKVQQLLNRKLNCNTPLIDVILPRDKNNYS